MANYAYPGGMPTPMSGTAAVRPSTAVPGTMYYATDTNALSVYDSALGWIALSGGGVTSITAGTGISVNRSSGAVTVTNSMGSHGVQAYMSGSGQSVTNATWTALTFDTNVFDTDSYHSTSVNNTRITIPSGLGGIYVVSVSGLEWTANGTGERICRIYKNGSSVWEMGRGAPGSTGSVFGFSASPAIIQCVATDYLEAYVYQSSGGSLALGASASGAWPYFAATLVGQGS